MGDLTADLLAANRTLLLLGLSLLLGALIGLQRGWAAREREAGSRIAGIRTYALVGLAGGFAALLSAQLQTWMLPAVFLGLTTLAVTGYWMRAAQVKDYSITGLIGLCLAFLLGAAVLVVDPTIPAAGAVVTALILDCKDELHKLLLKLEAHELDAGLKLLVITVVLLPVLPNQGYGPGGVLNPYQIWWLVVLIASVSFVGYFAIRVGGTEKGLLFTSLFAGLSSSTALTLHFAHLSRQSPHLNRFLAAGILIACGTMFPRILIYCALINPGLLPQVWPLAVSMMLLLYIPALLAWRSACREPAIERPALNQNPLDLKLALLFGVLLTLILLLGTWLEEWLGSTGIYLLAATSGITDVDAITLSLTRMAQDGLSAQTAVVGIVIAASVNNLVKTGMAAVVGSRALGQRVAGPMVLSVVAGLAIAWWL